MTASLEDLTNQFDILNQAVSSSFQNAINTADSWDDRLVNSVGSSINSRIGTWLANHPTLAWLVHHPLISLIAGLIAVVLIVRLVATIYRAIASTIDRMWLWILRSPFLLLKLLFGWEIKPKHNAVNTTITNYEVTSNPEQLQQIMARLDLIQQQQQQIIQDLEHLKQRSPYVEAKQVNLNLPATKQVKR